jgi:flagellar FliL protein
MAAPKLDASTDLGIEKTQGGGRRRLILVVLLAVVVLAAGGGAAWYFLAGSEPPATTAGKGKAVGKKGGEASTEKAEATRPEPVYHPLDPPFVANLPPGGKAKMLQAAVRVQTRDASLVSFLQKNDPMVRHHLLSLFGSQDAAELMTRPGRERLQTEVKDTLVRLVQENGGQGAVEAVYFTQFVLQ